MSKQTLICSYGSAEINRLEARLIKYVWGGGRAKMALSAAKCKCIDGGMGAFDIKASWLSFKLKWVGKLIKDISKDYSLIAQKLILCHFVTHPN